MLRKHTSWYLNLKERNKPMQAFEIKINDQQI